MRLFVGLGSCRLVPDQTHTHLHSVLTLAAALSLGAVRERLRYFPDDIALWIQHGNVRLARDDDLERALDATALSGDLDAGRQRQQPREPASDLGRVIDEEDSRYGSGRDGVHTTSIGGAISKKHQRKRIKSCC